MTATWAKATGRFLAADGGTFEVSAELTLRALTVTTPAGNELASWPTGQLLRASGPDGFRIECRRSPGALMIDIGANADFIRALAAIPERDAPMVPRQIVWTMLVIVLASLVALAGLAWGLFWLVGWLFAWGGGPTLSA